MLYVAAVYFFLQSIDALSIFDRSIYGAWSGKGGNKISETLNLLAILTSIFLFWSGTREISIARFNRILPLAAASFLPISAFWSVDPGVSLTQGTAYFFVVLGAIGLVEALGSDELIDLVALLCGLSAVASVVQLFIFPEPGDDFRGIFVHKNMLGQVMAGGVFAALHCVRIRGRRRVRYVSIIVLCTAVAFMSKSSTSILAIVAFFGVDILGRLYLRGGSTQMIGIWLSIGCVPILIYFMMNMDLISGLFGKDETFTGRTEFWPYVVDNIKAKPLLGWGFCGFWSLLNPVGFQILEALRGDRWWTLAIGNSHNAMLDFLLAIGFLGTSVFVSIWVRTFVMAVKCMSGPARNFGLSAVLLLIGISLVGVTETVLLAAAQIWTSLFFMMGFICEKELWIARVAWRPGWPVGGHPKRKIGLDLRGARPMLARRRGRAFHFRKSSNL
jgi:O-antigen ligase